MPSQCAYALCKIKKTRQNILQGITFHRFPTKNLPIRKQWIRAMRRVGGWQPKPWDVVDSTHFKPADFDRTGQTVRLRSGAVPSSFGLPEKSKKTKERNTKTSAKAKEPLTLFNHHNRKCSEDQKCTESNTETLARVRERLSNANQNEEEKSFTMTTAYQICISNYYQHNQKCNEDEQFTGSNTETTARVRERLGNANQDQGEKSLTTADQISIITKFHTYAATSPEDFKKKFRETLDRNEVLEKKLKNSCRREQYCKEKMKSLVCDLKNQNLLTDELAACLQTYGDIYLAEGN